MCQGIKESGPTINNTPKQEKSNQHKRRRYQNISIYIPEIKTACHCFSNTPSNLTVISKNSVPAQISVVKSKNDLRPTGGQKLGATATTPNQAADILIESADKALSQDFGNLLILQKS